jgi:hypothetical protein
MWLRKVFEVWWTTFVRSTAFRSVVVVGLRSLNVTWLSCDVIVCVADLLLGRTGVFTGSCQPCAP